MKHKIPKQFELMGQTITVIQDPAINKLAGCCGQSHYDTNVIIVDPTLLPDIKALTFYHELIHFCLHSLGRHDLDKDEAFVDALANLLWQYQKTSK